MGKTVWHRQAPGFYRSEDGHEIHHVEYWDGPWWVISYPDGAYSDPFYTLREAKRAVDLD